MEAKRNVEHEIEHERCGMCCRRLKDPKSRKRGFGPCCYAKYKAAKAREEMERNQQKLDLEAS